MQDKLINREILFQGEPTFYLGDNGAGQCKGIDIYIYPGAREVAIRPINSKGNLARCNIYVPGDPGVLRQMAEAFESAAKVAEGNQAGNVEKVIVIPRKALVGIQSTLSTVIASLNDASSVVERATTKSTHTRLNSNWAATKSSGSRNCWGGADMQTFTVLKIGENKGAPRIWAEGSRLVKAGFTAGRRYAIRVKEQTLILEAHEDGSRVVSAKRRGETEVPVIDLNSRELLSIFEGMSAVRVVMEEGKLFILPLASEAKRLQREARLKRELDAGSLTVGSLSHGGGILSHALHNGLQEEGLEPELAFANDIREDMLDHASSANEAWSERTSYIAAPMQELAFDEWAVSHLPKVSILEAGIPCSGASVAGRAKRGLAHPEEHPDVGHLAVAFIAIIARVQPAAVLLENVPAYQSSASASIIRNSLRDMGYEIHETVLDAAEWNTLEERKRFCLVAVSKGIHFDFSMVERPERIERSLAEVLENVPADDPRWSPMTYLKEKERRDKAAGKGFAMQVFGPEDKGIKTLTKGLQKNRSTDPKIRHPFNPELLRLPTPVEHARCKGIAEHLVPQGSATFAHEVLGQSICPRPFEAVARAIGKALKAWKDGARTTMVSGMDSDLFKAAA